MLLSWQVTNDCSLETEIPLQISPHSVDNLPLCELRPCFRAQLANVPSVNSSAAAMIKLSVRTSLGRRKGTDDSKGRTEQTEGAAPAWGAEMTELFKHELTSLVMPCICTCICEYTPVYPHLGLCFVAVPPCLPSLLESSTYLCTAATPSSVWNHAGCSHIPRGSVLVPGAGG